MSLSNAAAIPVSRTTGSLLGLAIGDALGYPAEFRSRQQILDEIDPAGIVDFISRDDPRFTRPFFASATTPPPGTFTDDTQMSVAVARGLLDSDMADLDTTMNAIAQHFVVWARSDDNNRSPGSTCMSGCAQLAAGVPWREAGVADSKGCGSAMRVAPIGLCATSVEECLHFARSSSLLTHGHDAGVEGAAAAALMVFLAMRDASYEDIYRSVQTHCSPRSDDFRTCWAKLPQMMSEPPEKVLKLGALGESWIAEEACASALYCCWKFPESFRDAILAGVNTDGDSDSIACIAGGIMGAKLGVERIDASWRQRIEDRDLLIDLAQRLYDLARRRAA